MSPRPISPQDKFAQATAVWIWSAVVSIPLVDAAYVAPFCLLAMPRVDNVGLCFLWAPFVMTLEHLLHEKRDISSIVAHYWPAPLIATAFTALFLWRWWRRDQNHAAR